MASKWRMSLLRLGDSSFLFVVSLKFSLSHFRTTCPIWIVYYCSYSEKQKPPGLSLSKDPFMVCPTCLLKDPSSKTTRFSSSSISKSLVCP
jgi:hypothetical protein